MEHLAVRTQGASLGPGEAIPVAVATAPSPLGVDRGLRSNPSGGQEPYAASLCPPALEVCPHRVGGPGTSLVAQRLGLCISTARGTGSILGRETKTPHAILHSQKIKNKLSWRP